MARLYVGWLALGLASSSWADPPARAQLILEVNPELEGCPDREGVFEAVATRLGYSPWSEDPSKRIEVRLAKVGGGVRAKVVLHDAGGATLGARDLGPFSRCAEALEPLVLVIALAIDPLGGRRRPDPPPVAPSIAATPVLAPEPVVVSTPAPPVETTPRVELAISGGASAGLVPAIVPIGAVELRLRWPAFSLAAGSVFHGPGSSPASGGTVTASLIAGSFDGCAHYRIAAACAVLTAGALYSSSEGLMNAIASTTAHATLSAKALADVPLSGPWSLRVQVELAVPLTRIQLIDSTSREPYWISPPVGGRAALGVVMAIE
jgi:hypothetical protein